MTHSYEQAQAFGGVIDVLEAVGAQYAVWGGLAVSIYGEPRFTIDMDVLLNGDSLALSPFVKRLLEMQYHVDESAVRKAVSGGFFNVIHLGYHIKTDFYVPTEPLLKQMITERKRLPFDEIRQAAYVTETAVVIAKLQAYKESGSTRHLDDVASVVRLQKQKLERERIEEIAVRLGLFGVWRALWGQG